MPFAQRKRNLNRNRLRIQHPVYLIALFLCGPEAL